MSKIEITKAHINAANPPQFAKLIGVTTTSVYRYVDGSEPNLSHLKRASKKFNIPFAEFCEMFNKWITDERERKILQSEVDLYLESSNSAAA